MVPQDIVDALGGWTYVVVFLITAGETAAFLGLLVPGETLILLAAASAPYSDLSPYLLAASVVGGWMAGDSIGFAVGSWYGHQPGTRRPRRWMSSGRVARANALFLRRGGSAVFIGRFIGLVRSFVPFAAGASGMPYRRFLSYSSAASLIWGTGNVAAGFFLGSSVTYVLHRVSWAGVAAAAVAILLCIQFRRRRTARRFPRVIPVTHTGELPSERGPGTATP
ncbi:DedA family protein [Streptomyces maoxianensis]|uniref:DedA family protein n=1 Tax=Streptomyces maoxianensis TaxID=1459942 RepID=A0ABV9GBG4_9ACTN